MFSFKKSSIIPPSLAKKSTYDSADIYKQLREDSFDKCYICGDKVAKDPRVEHFIPHENGKFIELKYDWNNLFLSCDYCNNKKSDSYNKGGNNILKPTIDEVEKKIGHYMEVFPHCEIELEPLSGDSTTIKTIEFLEEIYNNSSSAPAQKLKASNLRKNIFKELKAFQEALINFEDPDNTEEAKEHYKFNLERHLNKKTTFYEFKLGLINKHKSLKKRLGECKLLD